VLEGDLVRQANQICRGDGDVLRITAVAMFANHRAGGTELFLAPKARIAATARHEVMKTDAVARLETVYLVTDALDDTGNLVAEGERQWERRGPSAAVMGVGVADAGGFDADQGIGRADGGHRHFLQGQRAAGLEQSEGFHRPFLA
jgi:hypothetical protein